ncbi:hypothetical protein J3R82DRAFT_1705 [Butyriboletus roseoflavus]|nr:hypothetical protein J3R82DRAFT_1705 [Butyriboletus roseoflavus]
MLVNRGEAARLTPAFQLSRLHAEIDSLRGDPQQPYGNISNPLPPPPEPLPLDRFPAFARPGGAADTSDPLLTAVPYPPPRPRVQPTTTATITSGYPPVTSYVGTSHTQYVPSAPITFAVPRARHAEVPRADDRSKRPSTQEASGITRLQEERRPHAESSRTGAAEARYASADGRSHIVTGPPQARRVVLAPSPAPSWAHHPLVEERRSDDEREVEDVPSRVRTNGTNGVVSRSSDVVPRPNVDTRLASAEAYIQGYGFGYDSGLQIASEPSDFAPSSYGSVRSDRVHGFPVQESPDEPIGGLGLMGVPQPIPPGTVSTPDEDATPVGRKRWLTRRNTTQAVDTERSARRLGDQPLLDMPQNGGSRRVPVQTIHQVLGVRRTVTEGGSRHGINGTGDPGRRRRTMSGVAVPLAGESESPRSETTWGTVQTLSVDNISGDSMGSLALLVGLHNGGDRGQGSVTGESYVGREDASEEGETDETATPIITGSLSGAVSDVSSLGIIREDEGDHTGSRNGRILESTTLHHRSTSYPERIPQALEATQERRARRARRSEGVGDHRRHAAQSSTTEVLDPDGHRAANTSDIIGTNALSLHFDASFPAHDYQGHTSGPEIFAPTPIVGGPNIIHLWANRA